MILGVDNTAGITDVATMKAAGYTAIFRYLSNTPSKNLIMGSAPYDTELQRYLTAGISVVMNWEATGQLTTTNHPNDPHGQGAEDATRAQNQATLMGYPDAPIYFSIDFDCSDWAGLTAYFQGVASVIPLERIGVYGGYFVVDYCHANLLATFFWQTLAWSTVNGTAYTRHPVAHVIQRVGEVTVAGVSCDVDECLAADFGQLPRPAVPAPAPAPAPTPAPAVVQGTSMSKDVGIEYWVDTATGQRHFRGAAMCENASAAVGDSWVTWGVTWGSANVRTCFLSSDGQCVVSPHSGPVAVNCANYDVPPIGTRQFTIEGTCDPTAIVSVAVYEHAPAA